jgi:hypothetical protein
MSRIIHRVGGGKAKRWKRWVLAWLGLWRHIVEIVTICHCSSEAYSYVLFSEWIDE